MRTQTTADVFKLQDSSGEIDARQWATRDVSIDDSVCVFFSVSIIF